MIVGSSCTPDGGEDADGGEDGDEDEDEDEDAFGFARPFTAAPHR